MKLLFLVLIFCPLLAWSHPVTFEGGSSLMAEVSRPLQHYYLQYSPRWWWSGGAVVESIEQERLYSSVHLGLLVHRWNLEDAQGNFYLFGGPGYYTHRRLGQVLHEEGFTRMGAQFDFETRKYYLNIKYVERRGWDNFDALDNLYDVAIGFAPYVANYTELNSWFVLRYMDGDQMRESMISPTIRFFYKNYLWELAMSTRGEGQLNFMVHF